MGIFLKLFRKYGKSGGHPFCTAVVAAAGSSSRMEGEDKLFLTLDGIPVIARTLLNFQNNSLIDEIVVVTREESIVPVADICAEYGITKATKVIRGGKERSDSVLIGATAASPEAEYIAVQDGARPLASQELITEAVKTAYEYKAAAPAVPVSDTIKVVENGRVVKTLDRSKLSAMQTPQIFSADLLKAALKNVVDKGISVTDDCGAVELLGVLPAVSKGSAENIKITTPADIPVAEAIIHSRRNSV